MSQITAITPLMRKFKIGRVRALRILEEAGVRPTYTHHTAKRATPFFSTQEAEAALAAAQAAPRRKTDVEPSDNLETVLDALALVSDDTTRILQELAALREVVAQLPARVADTITAPASQADNPAE